MSIKAVTGWPSIDTSKSVARGLELRVGFGFGSRLRLVASFCFVSRLGLLCVVVVVDDVLSSYMVVGGGSSAFPLEATSPPKVAGFSFPYGGLGTFFVRCCCGSVT